MGEEVGVLGCFVLLFYFIIMSGLVQDGVLLCFCLCWLVFFCLFCFSIFFFQGSSWRGKRAWKANLQSQETREYVWLFGGGGLNWKCVNSSPIGG